ncbi:MAG: monomethylamine:corrinoid methyltransferase [Desulfobacula sp.]|uniref:monomethylamine:corrinoid methyltransferase n=2 Tax=Desulfobacula sp. TaxID=2593537 RepID=UPI001D86EA6C|nr:monomethylamine:corrinoid methyltransferase [Desulfobacula sp.]MBT6751637.1 monomethylamine:corrinoid methyltransferase [Desulfobacula sp.]
MSTAYRHWEIIDRARTGKFMDEDDFLPRHFSPTLKKLIKKYEIKYDPKTPCPTDDAMADRIWQAAWELFREIGYYNTDSHRVIEVTDQEIKEALYMANDRYTLGGGKDARVMRHRFVEDSEPPFCIMSPDITVDEKYHQSMCMAYLKEPLLDGLCGPILEETFGHLIESGGPTEISGCIQHIQNQKMAARLLGRPDTFMVAVGTAEHDSGQIAVSNEEWGVQKTDARLVGSLTEFKTADTLLNRSLHYAQYGCYTGNLTGAIYGGWCGGSEGTAITTVAYSLIGLVIHGAMFNQHFPFHLNYGSNTTRELLWPIAMAGQALSRNSKLLYTSNGFANAGPMTEMLFRETAAHAMVSTVSGWHLWEMASTRNKYRNRATPLEARLGCEVGHAVAQQRMTREQVNEITNKLLAKYEDHAADASMGSEYHECYDVAKAIPTVEHMDMFYRIKDEIAEMGIEFPY